AAPKTVREFQMPGDEVVDLVTVAAGDPLTVNPNPTSAAIANSFKIIRMFWVVLPARTPRQLIKVRIARATDAKTAVIVSFASKFPRAQEYFARVTATAAIPPVWVTSSSAQP